MPDTFTDKFPEAPGRYNVRRKSDPTITDVIAWQSNLQFVHVQGAIVRVEDLEYGDLVADVPMTPSKVQQNPTEKQAAGAVV